MNMETETKSALYMRRAILVLTMIAYHVVFILIASAEILTSVIKFTYNEVIAYWKDVKPRYIAFIDDMKGKW